MGRMGSSSEMLAKYGSSQGAYQRNNPQSFPVSLHSRHTPSPNITLGSPMRVVADGKYQVSRLDILNNNNKQPFKSGHVE